MIPSISRESLERRMYYWHYFASVFDGIVDSDTEIAWDLEKYTNIIFRDISIFLCRSIGDIGDL
jgi:hypothetical protein